MHFRRPVLLILLALLLAACSTTGGAAVGDTTTSPSAATNTTPYRVSLQDAGPSPANLTIPIGATVVWVNETYMDREVHAESNLFDGPVAPGASYQWTFTTAGTFAYHCHPTGAGTITVTG